MKVVEPGYIVLNFTPGVLSIIERAGRVCYQSESTGDPEKFVRSLVKRGHHSVLEHASVTIQLIVDRAVSMELIRHRLASYSQESQRYVNYKNQDIEFIRPSQIQADSPEDVIWGAAMCTAEDSYKILIKHGYAPQTARSVLPNSTKTEIIVSANLREWRHIFQLRTSPAAHPDMRYIMLQVLRDFANRWPELFDDLLPEEKPEPKKENLYRYTLEGVFTTPDGLAIRPSSIQRKPYCSFEAACQEATKEIWQNAHKHPPLGRKYWIIEEVPESLNIQELTTTPQDFKQLLAEQLD